ncbi:MAG: LysR family transcriptional regulator [Bdellovibrionota bacterium]
METDRLRYFCAIVDAGSMTRAAEALAVSHSGLSKAISTLESELGFDVFRPQGRGLELTREGRALYQQSREILSRVNSLREIDRADEARTGFKLGLPEALALALASGLVGATEDEIEMEEMDSGEIEARVLDSKIDFGFTFVPFPHADLDHLKIANVTIGAFARNGVFDSLEPEAVPFVVPSTELKDNPLSLKIRDGWNAKYSRLIRYRVNTLAIAFELARSGACAVFAPDFVIERLNDSSARKLVPLPQLPPQTRTKRDVFLVKRKDVDETKPMKRTVSQVRKLCR